MIDIRNLALDTGKMKSLVFLILNLSGNSLGYGVIVAAI